MESEQKMKKAFCYACFPRTTEPVEDELMTAFINAALPKVNTQVINSFIDNDNKKQPKNRPNWNAMLEECKDEEIDLIIIPAIAMLAHNTFDAISIAREAKRKHSVDFFFLLENIYTAEDDADTKLSFYSMIQEQIEIQNKQKKKMRKLFKKVCEE